MGQGVDLQGLRAGGIDLADARQGVGATNVHGARAANTLATGATERQCGINLVLDLDEGIQHHGTTLAHVDLVGLHVRLLACIVRVPAVDLELLNLRLRCLLGLGLLFHLRGVADSTQLKETQQTIC